MKHNHKQRNHALSRSGIGLALRIMLISASLLLVSIIILLIPGCLNSLLALGLTIAMLEPVEKFAIVGFLTLSLVVKNKEKVIALVTQSRLVEVTKRQSSPRSSDPTVQRQIPVSEATATRGSPCQSGAKSLPIRDQVWKWTPVNSTKPFTYKISWNVANTLAPVVNEDTQTVQDGVSLVECSRW